MTTTTAKTTESTDDSTASCWCCGQSQPRQHMVRLGNHPEVGVCIRCAHFLHKQAGGLEDRQRAGVLPRLRDGLRTIREGVVQRGWHQRPLIGRPLRWLGKFLP